MKDYEDLLKEHGHWPTSHHEWWGYNLAILKRDFPEIHERVVATVMNEITAHRTMQARLATVGLMNRLNMAPCQYGCTEQVSNATCPTHGIAEFLKGILGAPVERPRMHEVYWNGGKHGCAWLADSEGRHVEEGTDMPCTCPCGKQPTRGVEGTFGEHLDTIVYPHE